MFEEFTLEKQREIEVARGWKPSYLALTYSTAEGVLFRRPFEGAELQELEILDAERASGAPDCLGKRQGKWGTYIYPTDPTARHAFKRGLKQQFGWDVPLDRFRLAGIVGPWLHKATMASDASGNLILSVTEEQAEKTPFEAKLFWTNVTGFELGTGDYLKATAGARWITVGDLIAEQGQNHDYMYWIMIALGLRSEWTPGSTRPDDLIHYFKPGKHRFP